MEIDWMQMVRYQQQLQKISRYLFPVKKQLLTPSECELLAWLYLHPEKNTPVVLSQCSGMKREAVSRCLKNLFEKGCIRKEKQPQDERSYRLFLTETGRTALQRGCENMLEPFYTLWRSIGPDFEDFLKCAGRIAGQMAEKKGDAD